MTLKYKKFANNVTEMKTLTKKQYYANELENSRGNPQKTWELLRTLLVGKSHCSTVLPRLSGLVGTAFLQNLNG